MSQEEMNEKWATEGDFRVMLFFIKENTYLQLDLS